MIRLKLISLNGAHFDEDVYEVIIPTKDGEIAVYGGHAPLLSVASPGLVAIRKDKNIKDDNREFVAIYGGTIEVLNDTVIVLVDEVDIPSEIHEAEAEKAYQRALEHKTKAKDVVALQEAQAMIDRSAVRLKLANIKKRSHRR